MKKKVLAALGSLIAMNVVCLSMLTFAWFTANQRADNAMNQIVAISDDPLDVDFELYEYDEDTLTGRVAIDRKESLEDGTERDISRFALPQYDTFITERNTYNNKILRIEVSWKTTADSNTKFSLDIPCSGDFTSNVGGEDKVTKNMSNIIGFKYFLRHETNAILDESSAGSIYDSAYSVFGNIDEKVGYVSVEGEVGTKVNDKTIHLSDLDIDESATDNKTILYLEYFYDESLIDYYFEHSEDSKPTADNLASNAISFSCDILRFEFIGDGK